MSEQATLGGETVEVEAYNDGDEGCDWQMSDGKMCGNSASLRVSLPDGWLYSCRVHAEADWLAALEETEDE